MSSSPMSDADTGPEWVMAEPAHAQELMRRSPDPRRKVILTTDAGNPAEDAAITELRLYASGTERMKNFPERIRRLPHLKVLALGPGIDKAMLAQLTPGAIPPSVETLKVFTDTVAASWPADLTMPHVRELRTDCALGLAGGEFPNLRAVSIAPARNGKNLDAVLACRDLAEVQLLIVPGNGVFERMKHLPLRRLGLLGGTIETLQGIGALPGVEWLLLHNLRSLKSIGDLTALKELQEVQIRYCKKIQDIESLARLPRLRRLEVFACGNLGLAKIKPFLDKLDKVVLSASS